MELKKIAFIQSLLVAIVLCQTPYELLDQGKILLEQGDLNGAEESVKSALKIDNGLAEGHFILSQIYLTRNDLNACREHLNRAIEIDQYNEDYRTDFDKVNDVAKMMAIGLKSLETGNHEKAIVTFDLVIEKLPLYAAAPIYYIGVAVGREGDVREAANQFRESLKINPDYERASSALINFTNRTFNEGNQYIRRGDYDSAIESYQLVLELDPLYYKAYFQLGVVNTKLGDYAVAIDNYRKTVNIEPNFSKGWFALGLGLQKNDRLEEGLEAFKEATEVDPTYAKAHSQMGTIYIILEDFNSAENAFNMAIQVDPSYAKPYQNLGNIYVEHERFDEAINTLLTATALDGKSPKSWYFLSRAYNATDQCDEAREAALGALRTKKNYAPAQFELGTAEICLGNKTAALQAFEKARKDRSWRKSAEYEIDKIKNPHKYENVK